MSSTAAIFFIFSRAGCEKAAAMVAGSLFGTLDSSLESTEEMVGAHGNSRKRQKKSRQRGKKSKTVLDKHGREFRSDGDFLSEDVFMSMLDDTDGSLPFSGDELSPLSESRIELFGKMGLLTQQEVLDVASRIVTFNRNNEEIPFPDEVIEQLLMGVGSHHAGMLPAHKSFVEFLFQNQLMKVVFATETLAAGINMPARSTVICALAKRGSSSSMELLETSNLLQMAGRAGRRGKDLEGNCVILASPFETYDDAINILIGEIKPINSQFSPSYSLCINLILRGNGSLNVAKQLVGKSFAMWQRNQEPPASSVENGESSRGEFLGNMVLTLKSVVDEENDQYSDQDLANLWELLENRGTLLKRASKLLRGISQTIELEETTLFYLKKEYMELPTNTDIVGDREDLLQHIETQEERIQRAKTEFARHPFTTATELFNSVIRGNGPSAKKLAKMLENARSDPAELDSTLTPAELSTFAKAAIKAKRKDRSRRPDIVQKESDMQDAWKDFLAMTKTLVKYGCLEPQLDESSNITRYRITDAGNHCGLLGFDNSLWVLVALGGVWTDTDTPAATFERSDGETPTGESSKRSADEIADILSSMTSSELAGYLSCIIGDGGRDSSSVIEHFQGLDMIHQQAVRKAFSVLDHFESTQRESGVSQDLM